MKLSVERGIIIAKRSASLSKTYLATAIFLAFVGVLLYNLHGFIGNLSGTGIPANHTAVGPSTLTAPLLSVSLQVLAAVLFATPVLLLYVYDKNNGVLEYFLSLGMNQSDIYGQYLQAALILSSILIVLEVVVNIIAGVISGASGTLSLEVSVLIVALALPAVSLGTLVMMSFSSLQKQRVGSNQPLGMAISVFIVMPTYVVSLVVPSLGFLIDLVVAGITVALSLLVYFSASRLIRREKLLP
jgi:hypothetical protein